MSPSDVVVLSGTSAEALEQPLMGGRPLPSAAAPASTSSPAAAPDVDSSPIERGTLYIRQDDGYQKHDVFVTSWPEKNQRYRDDQGGSGVVFRASGHLAVVDSTGKVRAAIPTGTGVPPQVCVNERNQTVLVLEGGLLSLYDLEHGGKVAERAVPAVTQGRIVMSPEHQAYLLDASGIHLLDDGLADTRCTPMPGFFPRDLAFRPDGSVVVTGDRSINGWPGEGGTLLVVVDGSGQVVLGEQTDVRTVRVGPEGNVYWYSRGAVQKWTGIRPGIQSISLQKDDQGYAVDRPDIVPLTGERLLVNHASGISVYTPDGERIVSFSPEGDRQQLVLSPDHRHAFALLHRYDQPSPYKVVRLDFERDFPPGYHVRLRQWLQRQPQEPGVVWSGNGSVRLGMADDGRLAVLGASGSCILSPDGTSQAFATPQEVAARLGDVRVTVDERQKVYASGEAFVSVEGRAFSPIPAGEIRLAPSPATPPPQRVPEADATDALTRLWSENPEEGQEVSDYSFDDGRTVHVRHHEVECENPGGKTVNLRLSLRADENIITVAPFQRQGRPCVAVGTSAGRFLWTQAEVSTSLSIDGYMVGGAVDHIWQQSPHTLAASTRKGNQILVDLAHGPGEEITVSSPQAPLAAQPKDGTATVQDDDGFIMIGNVRVDKRRSPAAA